MKDRIKKILKAKVLLLEEKPASSLTTDDIDTLHVIAKTLNALASKGPPPTLPPKDDGLTQTESKILAAQLTSKPR